MEYSLRSRSKPTESKIPYSMRKKEKEESKVVTALTRQHLRMRKGTSDSEPLRSSSRLTSRRPLEPSRNHSTGNLQSLSKRSIRSEESENELRSYDSSRMEEKTESNTSSRKSRRILEVNNLLSSSDYNQIVVKKIQRNFPFVDVARLSEFLNHELQNVTSTASVIEAFSVEKEFKRERELRSVIDRLLNEKIFRESKGNDLPIDSAQLACGRQEVKIHKVLNKYRRFDLHKEILQLNPDLDIKNADICELSYLYSNMLKKIRDNDIKLENQIISTSCSDDHGSEAYPEKNLIFSPILEFKEEYHSDEEDRRENHESVKRLSINESPRKTELTIKVQGHHEAAHVLEKIINYSSDSIKNDLDEIDENEKAKMPFLDQLSKKFLDFNNIQNLLDDYEGFHHHPLDPAPKREVYFSHETERAKENVMEVEMRDLREYNDSDCLMNFLI